MPGASENQISHRNCWSIRHAKNISWYQSLYTEWLLTMSMLSYWKCSFPVKEVIQFLIIISLKWANTAISSRYQFIHYHKVSHLFHQTWGIRKLLLYCYFCMWIAHIVALLKKLYLQLAPLKLHLVHQSPKMKVCWIQLKSVPEKCSVHYIFISRKQFFRS